MSEDFYSLGTALAGVMGTAVLSSTPPVGGTAIRTATVLAPNNVTYSPFLVVELPSSSADVAVETGRQKYVDDWDVYLVFDRAAGDLPRIRQTLLMWLGPMLASTYGAMKLGLGTQVDKAYVTSYEETTYSYGTQASVTSPTQANHPAWHFVVRLWHTGSLTVTP